MLEAHILPQMLAASLAAAQPIPAPGPTAPAVQAPSAIDAGNGETAPVAPPVAPPPPPAEVITPPVGVPAAAAPPPPAIVPGLRDPLQGFNRFSYKISQPVDRFIIRPAALAYKTVIPHPLRDGVRNFIRNLFEPLVFVNDLLQLRPKRAVHTLARLALNTAVGIGGVFDVAKRPPFHLARHDNGFGDTLGYYGVGPLAYIYLPVLGPTTVRDLVGEVGDAYAQPRLLDRLVHPDSDKPLLRSKLPFGKTTVIVDAFSGIDQRAENDDELETIKRTSVDPYASLRSSFLQDRAGEIAALKSRSGQAPINPLFEDPLADPAGK